ncbi:MAG: YggS family pyridoxal phosphate-dependent enzyme [Clostridia bacterium]|nr:YggS family pyridoxal phosphate-dependent enzyme [Clostridia bacterium]
MTEREIAARVSEIKAELSKGNAFGEKVRLIAATKMQSAEIINYAIAAGVDAVAENKPQEFRDKNELLLPCPRHFIGHLQTNKIKYLLGKIELYHSCDRDELASELARMSTAKGLVSNILIQINAGEEETKGGYPLETAKEVYKRLSQTQGLNVKGFMAMLPDSDDENLLRSLARKMRALYEWAREQSSEVEYLSMGMSGDYKLCIEEGSNAVRLGSTIFGRRDYGVK